MDDWMDRLREQTGDVRPAGEAPDRITQELSRRRRHRNRLAGAGTVASVAVVVGAVAFAPRLLDRDATDPVDPATSAPSTVATAPADSGSSNLLPEFTCPLENPVFTEDPPEPDPAMFNAYKRTYSEVVARDFEGFEVAEIEVFNAGVFALVTGNLARAERELGELGVAGVQLWDPSGPDVGLDAYAQLEQLIGWRLDPILRHARQATRGIPGQAGFAYWHDADAIFVQWKEPVPAEVQALEDTRFKSGGSIIVRGVTHSAADVRRAQDELQDWLVDNDWRDDWSSASSCGDFTGLVVGLTPDSLADADVPGLAREISDGVGMPVRVVPEEQPVPLG